MDMQAAIKQLQETAIVMAGIHARQAVALKAHGQWLEDHTLAMRHHDERVAEHEERMAELDRKLDRIAELILRGRGPNGGGRE